MYPFEQSFGTLCRSPRILQRLALLGALVLVTLGQVSIGTGQALAVVGCRSDPVVVLSNLKSLDLSTQIADSSSDLRSVTYTLHLPVGVKPLLVVPTDGLVGQTEHFQSYSDQTAGSYVVDTYVSTGTTVPVTATILGVLAPSGSVSGTSNETLRMSF